MKTRLPLLVLLFPLLVLGAAPSLAAAQEGEDPQARTYFERGRDIYFAHQDADKAIIDLSHAVARAPAFVEAYLLLGNILLAEGRPGEVLDLTERALVALPLDNGIMTLRARGLLALGRDEEVGRIREEMAGRKGGSAPAHWIAALRAERDGDHEGRKKALERALAAVPADDLRVEILWELVSLGEIVGDVAAARKAYRELVQLPVAEDVKIRYLRFLVRHGIGAEDLLLYGRPLVEREKALPEGYLFLGWGLLLSGSAEEALYMAEEGRIRGGPGGPLERLLAEIYLALGYPAKAVEHANRSRDEGIGEDLSAALLAKAAGVEGEREYRGPRVRVEPEGLEVGAIMDDVLSRATLAIRNAGEEPLRLLSLRVEKVPVRIISFAVPSWEVPPGGEVEVGVEVMGFGGPFELRGEIVLLSNDQMRPSVIVPVTGSIGPVMEAYFETEPNSPLILGEIPAGSEVVRKFKVQNLGNKAMRIKRVLTSAGVAYEGFDVQEIPPGGEERITMRWRPTRESGLATGKIAIFTDDTYYLRNDIYMQAIIVPAGKKE